MSERDIVERLRDWAGCMRGPPIEAYRTLLEAADEIERLRSAPGQTEASVSTRTPEHGLSYHDETEALREALEATRRVASLEMAKLRTRLSHPPTHVLNECDEWLAREVRRALSQHVGGEG